MHKALHPSSLIPAGFAMVAASSDGDRTTVTVRSISKSSCCPTCGTDSNRVHSRYQRRIADLPLAGRLVRLIAEVCRFRCAATQCGQQIFTEQFPTGVLAPWARRTGRLDVLVHHLGLALGGRPAASLAKRLMLPVSNDTLLRVVRRRGCPVRPAPTVIGIDDWAWRRNHRYGTIICDLERRKPISLLPDREPATAQAWLTTQPQITVVARDRGGAYARAAEKKYKEVASALTNLMAIASGYGEQILVEHIETEIATATRERTGLLLVIETLGDETDDPAATQALKAARAEALRAFRTSRRRVVDLADAIETLEYEIADANAFLAHLHESLRDFDDAALTFVALGRLDFAVCPSCFAPVREKAVDHCQLCDEPHVNGAEDSRTLAVRLDLQMQLRESTALQEERRTELALMTANLRIAKLALRRATTTIEVGRAGPATKREANIAELSRRVGFLDSQLEVLQKRLELGRNIRAISAQKEDLNNDVIRLRGEVEAIGRSQDQRKRSAYTLISNEAKALLDDDLVEHSDFDKVEYVNFDFADDWIGINNDRHRAGSASGMVVLKNSFAAATLLASLADARFYLPRWMLFDNVEDKGMVEERSWNFQRLLVERSAKSDAFHQIIFSTSKIAPELEGSGLVVGRKYTKAAPSLAIVGQLRPSVPEV